MYSFLYLNIKLKEMTRVVNSAKGTTNQTPFTPKIFGNILMPTAKNINVLSKEIKADTFPFENAVNIPDENILIPSTKNPIENNKNPLWAISN